MVVKYTIVKVDGATPKRWLSKGAMINQYMGVAPSTFQVVYLHENHTNQQNVGGYSIHGAYGV